MDEIHGWLEEKLSHNWTSVRAARVVEWEWKLHTGGRTLYAGLSLAVWPAETFSLEVDAAGIDENFIAGAKNGLFSVLLGHSHSPTLSLRARLSDFVVDDVGASYYSFYQVAREATERALGIAEGTKHNLSG